MFCRNCGAKILEGGSFCGSCGTPVKEETAAGGKKIDVSGEAGKNSSDVETQGKSRKPFIIGVCSVGLLLAIGAAVLFATGMIGGKDKPKEPLAGAEESEEEKAADSEEQEKEETAEDLVVEVTMEEKEREEDTEEEEPNQDVIEAKENTGEIDWRQSYRDAIEDNLAEIGLADSFGFHDINEDGIPEIFTHVASHVDIMLYVKKDGSVGIASAQKYHGNLLRNDDEVYNSPEEHIYTSLYEYNKNDDTYKPVEGKCISRKWDGNENTYFMGDTEISEQEYNAIQKEIDEIGWKDGHDSNYSLENYGLGTSGMLYAMDEWSSSDSEDGDYLCSDSAVRILTEEDIEKLRSGTYDDLPEGKGIIQMVVNEMYARKGYQFGVQGIQDYFETKEWYQKITERSHDQESIYQNMSEIEQANVQFLSSFSEDLQGSVDVEAEVAQIREWFYDTQERQDSLMYGEYGQGKYYFEFGYAIKGVLPAGYNEWDYTREYYYHNQELYFAFIFAGSEEYRLYFKDGKVIRYIDNNGTVYDYGNIGEGEQLGEKVKLESEALYPDVNCGL